MCDEGLISVDGDPGAVRMLKKIVMHYFIHNGCVFMKAENPPGRPRKLWLMPKKCCYKLMRAAHSDRFLGQGS
jgi:hypothetical protein